MKARPHPPGGASAEIPQYLLRSFQSAKRPVQSSQFMVKTTQNKPAQAIFQKNRTSGWSNIARPAYPEIFQAFAATTKTNPNKPFSEKNA
ncbi:MAG TPA: hypothetical protein VGO59_21260 [Verrucomicrobiae bacterium]|jgi:hypothetical protein